MKKEQRIQYNQNLLANINEVKKGLVNMVDVVPEDFELEDLYINEHFALPCYHENFAKGLKDEAVEYELKEAHNKYVALLIEVQLRKGLELDKLLSNRTQNNDKN